MSDKVKSRLMIAGAAFCAALFLFSGAMLAREYLDQKQSAEAFDEVAGLVKEDVELPALELADDPAQEPEELTAFEKYADVYAKNSDLVGWIDEKVSQILKMLHLENFKDCHPYALSGGQKQRLTIGAAMLSEKPIIVLDEPTSGLDWDNMCAVANAVNYMREAGKLVFIITHDLEFISLTASRALLLKEGIIKDDLQMTEQNNFKIVKNFMVEEGGE